jgi:hypothetical protein
MFNIRKYTVFKESDTTKIRKKTTTRYDSKITRPTYVPSVFISPTTVPKIISSLKGDSTAEFVLTTEHKTTTTVVSVHEEQKFDFYSTAGNAIRSTSSATSTDQSTTSLLTVSSTISTEPEQPYAVPDNSTTVNFDVDSVKLASGDQTNGDVVTDGMSSNSFVPVSYQRYNSTHEVHHIRDPKGGQVEIVVGVVYEPPEYEPPAYAEVVIDTKKQFLTVSPETATDPFISKVDNYGSTLVPNESLTQSAIDYDVVDYGEISEIYTDFDQNVTQALISEPIKVLGPAEKYPHRPLTIDVKTEDYLRNPAVLYGAIGKG